MIYVVKYSINGEKTSKSFNKKSQAYAFALMQENSSVERFMTDSDKTNKK